MAFSCITLTHDSNGTISSMDIVVDPRVRVLSVEGPSLKRWDVAKGTADPKNPSKACIVVSLCVV